MKIYDLHRNHKLNVIVACIQLKNNFEISKTIPRRVFTNLLLTIFNVVTLLVRAIIVNTFICGLHHRNTKQYRMHVPLNIFQQCRLDPPAPWSLF